jgi:hypothetical protein
MFNKKKEITMLNKKIKKLRIKLLNNMKQSTVFIPNSAGKFTTYTVVWKNKTYTGLSPNHTIAKIVGVQ